MKNVGWKIILLLGIGLFDYSLQAQGVSRKKSSGGALKAKKEVKKIVKVSPRKALSVSKKSVIKFRMKKLRSLIMMKKEGARVSKKVASFKAKALAKKAMTSKFGVQSFAKKRSAKFVKKAVLSPRFLVAKRNIEKTKTQSVKKVLTERPYQEKKISKKVEYKSKGRDLSHVPKEEGLAEENYRPAMLLAATLSRSKNNRSQKTSVRVEELFFGDRSQLKHKALSLYKSFRADSQSLNFQAHAKDLVYNSIGIFSEGEKGTEAVVRAFDSYVSLVKSADVDYLKDSPKALHEYREFFASLDLL